MKSFLSLLLHNTIRSCQKRFQSSLVPLTKKFCTSIISTETKENTKDLSKNSTNVKRIGPTRCIVCLSSSHLWFDCSIGVLTEVREKLSRKVPLQRNGMTKEKFLRIIGKGAVETSTLFESWEDLMSSTNESLKKKEINVLTRRYILEWINKYKIGIDPHPLRLIRKLRKRKHAKPRPYRIIAEKKKAQQRKELSKQYYSRLNK